MSKPTVSDQLDTFLDLINRGLYLEVHAWIKANKPIYQPAKPWRRWPLWVAVRSGSEGMVAMILTARRWDKEHLRQSLRRAVRDGCPGVIKLLLDAGAPPMAITFADVAEKGGAIMEMFIRAGYTFAGSNEFAEALLTVPRPALGILIKLGKEYPDLNEQALIALAIAVDRNMPGTIAKLTWAKVDPSKRQSAADEFSAAECACLQRNVECLRALKLRLSPDQALELMHLLESGPLPTHYRYLLRFVPLDIINSGPRSSSPLLKRMLERTEVKHGNPLIPLEQRVKDALGSVRELVDYGARWKPTAREAYLTLGALRFQGPEYPDEVVKILSRSNSVSNRRAAWLLTYWMRNRHQAPSAVAFYR